MLRPMWTHVRSEWTTGVTLRRPSTESGISRDKMARDSGVKPQMYTGVAGRSHLKR